MSFRRLPWQVLVASSLLLLSALGYLIHFAIFRDTHQIFVYLVQDLAFLPIEVLLVAIIVERVLTYWERRDRANRMKPVIGAFFSEMGTSLLAELSSLDPRLTEISEHLALAPGWSQREFALAHRQLREHSYNVELDLVDLHALQGFLHGYRDFLLQLMQNGELLEHESFTDLLHSVFHLSEELTQRETFVSLPAPDIAHLTVDVSRVYTLLAREWLEHMAYLSVEYPHLYSLAMRRNPFAREASVIIHA